MTFTGIFIGANGHMGYQNGKKYTVSTHKDSQGMKIISAPDDRFHQFKSEAELLKLWQVTG